MDVVDVVVDRSAIEQRMIELAEEGLSLLAAAASGGIYETKAYREWCLQNKGHSMSSLGSILATLPKGTVLCVR